MFWKEEIMNEHYDKCLTCDHYMHMHSYHTEKKDCIAWNKRKGWCKCDRYNNDPFERMISNIDKPKEDLYGQMS